MFSQPNSPHWQKKTVCQKDASERKESMPLLCQILHISQDLLQLHLKVPKGKEPVHTNTESLGLLVYPRSYLDPKHLQKESQGLEAESAVKGSQLKNQQTVQGQDS